MNIKKTTALVILDGFGYQKEVEHNAIAQANLTNINRWLHEYPHTLLQASGKAVGLPDGYCGNSEVGHCTIGTGRIIQQPLTIIENAIKNGDLTKNKVLCQTLSHVAQTNNVLHIIGLLSDAGVHSITQFLYALVEIAVQANIKKIMIHAITDGRDTPACYALPYLEKLDSFLKLHPTCFLGSLHGRFYAMDRDHHWQRTQLSYQTLTSLKTTTILPWQTVIENAYLQGITDEFLLPTQLRPDAFIQNNDGIIFANFRPDRARQLTACFVKKDFDSFKRKKLKINFFITPVSYGTDLPTTALFTMPKINNSLKQVLSDHHKTIFSIAETEKYAHVTYFFNGGHEKSFATEKRILVPSLGVKKYDRFPEMSAEKITYNVLKSLDAMPYDFYLINYANPDMVGHSGDLNATIKALQCIDAQLAQLYQAIVIKRKGTLYITGDHGKAENMFDTSFNMPRTGHTTNPVPFIMLRQDLKDKQYILPLQQLDDIAPFILTNMGLPVPEEMQHRD